MNVAFYVDGGPEMGMGHIVRCLSLASVWEKKGHSVFFISRVSEGRRLISSRGFEMTSYYMHKRSMEYKNLIKNCQEDIASIISVVKQYKIDVFIVDHYNVTSEFFLTLKPYVKVLCYIDDLSAFSYPVDVVVNGNITGQYMYYKKYYKKQVFLLGPRYNLIRDEFCRIPKRPISKEVHKVMITTGASDNFRITEKIINIIRNEMTLNNIELHVIIGNSFVDRNKLKEVIDCYDNIVYYENIKEISSVMLECDLAISSSGSTLYELCACGLPTLGFILADNQKFIAETMNNLGYIKNLGWYHQLNKESMIKEIQHLINDYSLRAGMVLKQQILVDGRGSQRVVHAIEKMVREKGNELYEC